jgi:hypothetical protein
METVRSLGPTRNLCRLFTRSHKLTKPEHARNIPLSILHRVWVITLFLCSQHRNIFTSSNLLEFVRYFHVFKQVRETNLLRMLAQERTSMMLRTPTTRQNFEHATYAPASPLFYSLLPNTSPENHPSHLRNLLRHVRNPIRVSLIHFAFW